MKKLVFFPAMFLFIFLSAQQSNYDFKKYLENNKQQVLGNKNELTPDNNRLFRNTIRTTAPSKPQATYLYSFSNGNKVFALPQDQMPCIVPDMKQFNMPVVGKSMIILGMPPDFIPRQKIIPDNDSQ